MRKFFDKLMKALGKKNDTNTRRNLQLEPLEERQLLTASTLSGDDVPAYVATSGANKDSASLVMDIKEEIVNLGDTGGAYFYLNLEGTGTTLNGATQVDLNGNENIEIVKYVNKGDSDLFVLHVTDAGKFKLTFSGINATNTDGAISAGLSLAGDYNDNGFVTGQEALYVEGSLTALAFQSQIGKNGPSYSNLNPTYLAQYGMNYTDLIANKASFDLDKSEAIDSTDINWVNANKAFSDKVQALIDQDKTDDIDELADVVKFTSDDAIPIYVGVYNIGTPTNGTYFVDPATNAASSTAYCGDIDNLNTLEQYNAGEADNGYISFTDESDLRLITVGIKCNGGTDYVATLDLKTDDYASFLVQDDSADPQKYYIDLAIVDKWLSDNTDIASTAIDSLTFILTDDAENSLTKEVKLSLSAGAIVDPKTPDPDSGDVPIANKVGDPSGCEDINLAEVKGPDGNYIIADPNNTANPYSGSGLVYAIAGDTVTSSYRAKKELTIGDTTYSKDAELTADQIADLAFGEDYYTLYETVTQTQKVGENGSAADGTETIKYKYTLTSDGILDVEVLDDSAKFLSDPDTAGDVWSKATLPVDFVVTNFYNYAKYPTDFTQWTSGEFSTQINGENDTPTQDGSFTATVTLDKSAGTDTTAGEFNLLGNVADVDNAELLIVSAIDGQTLATVSGTVAAPTYGTTPLYAVLKAGEVDGVYTLEYKTDTTGLTDYIEFKFDSTNSIVDYTIYGNPVSFLKKGDSATFSFKYTVSDISGASVLDIPATVTLTNNYNATPVIGSATEVGTALNQNSDNADAFTINATDVNCGLNGTNYKGDTLTAAVTAVAFKEFKGADDTTKLITSAYNAASIDESLFTFAADGNVKELAGDPAASFDVLFTADDEFDFLGENESVVLTITYTVSDGTETATKTVELTIQGTNDTPSLTATELELDIDKLISDAGATIAVADLSITDVDVNDTFAFATGTTSGTKYLTADGLVDTQPTSGNYNTVVFSNDGTTLTIKVSDYDSTTSYLKWDLAENAPATFEFNIQIRDSANPVATSETVEFTASVDGKYDAPVVVSGQDIRVSYMTPLSDADDDDTAADDLKAIDSAKWLLDSGKTAASTALDFTGFTAVANISDIKGVDNTADNQQAIYNAVKDYINATNISVKTDGTLYFKDASAFQTAMETLFGTTLNGLTGFSISGITLSVTDDASTTSSAEPIKLSIVKKLSPVVTPATASVGTVIENGKIESVELDKAVADSGLFTVGTAEDEENFTSSRTSSEDWYDFTDLTVTSVVSSKGDSDKSQQIPFDDDAVKAAVQGLINDDSITLEEDGTWSIDLTNSTVFDYLGENGSATVTFTANVTDNDFSVATPVTLTLTVTGTADPLNADSVAGTIIDTLEKEGDDTDDAPAATELEWTMDQLFDLVDYTGNERYTVTIADTVTVGGDTITGLTFDAEQLETLAKLLKVDGTSVKYNSDAEADAIPAIKELLEQVPEDKSITLTWEVTAQFESATPVVSTIVLTVKGTNQAPVANAVDGEFAEGNNGSVNLVYSDIDKTDELTVSLVNGTSYEFTTTATENARTKVDIDAILKAIDSDNTAEVNLYGLELASLKADNSAVDFTYNNALNFLRAGESLTVVYKYTVTDKLSDTADAEITIKITGVDTAPATSTRTITSVDDEIGSTKQETTDTGYADTDVEAQNSLVGGYSVASIKCTGTTDVDDLSKVNAFFGTELTNENLTAGISFDTDTDKFGYTLPESLQDAIKKLNQDETLVIVFNYTTASGTAQTTDNTLTVTITGKNQAPTVEDVNNGEGFAEAGTGTIALDYNDVDDADILTVSGPTYVSYTTSDRVKAQLTTLAADSTGDTDDDRIGNYLTSLNLISTLASDATVATYAYNNALDFLRAGESLTVVYNYTVNDGTASAVSNTITLKINGVSTTPEAAAKEWTVDDDDTDKDTTYTDTDIEDNAISYTLGAIKSLKYVEGTVEKTVVYNVTDAGTQISTADFNKILNSQGVTWEDVLTVEGGKFTYNNAQTKWINAGSSIIVEYALTATSTNGQANSYGTYTLTITGTQTPLDAAGSKEVTAVTAIPAETTGDYTGYVKAGTFKVAADYERDYEFTATGVTDKNSTDVTGYESDDFKFAYNSETREVTVYVLKAQLGDTLRYNATDGPYTVTLSYDDNAGDADELAFTLNVSNKSVPDIDGTYTDDACTDSYDSSVATDEDAKKEVYVKVSDPDDMTGRATGNWCSVAITDVTAITGLTGEGIADDLKGLFEASINSQTIIDEGATETTAVVKFTLNADTDTTVLDQLKAGDNLSFTLNYTVTDKDYSVTKTGSIVFNIIGTNDAPVAKTTTLATGVHTLTELNISDLATDIDDGLNLGKLAVYASTTAADPIAVLDQNGATATLTDGTKVTLVDVTTGKFTIDYSGTDLYSSIAVSEQSIKLGVFDKADASVNATYTVNVTGDYIAPEFDDTKAVIINGIIGSTRVTEGATAATSVYYGDEGQAERNVETVDLDELLKTNNASNLTYSISWTYDSQEYTLADGETKTEGLPTSIKSINLNAGVLTVSYMNKTEFTNTADLSDLPITVKVNDTKASAEDTAEIVLSLKEKNVVEIKAVANANAFDGTRDDILSLTYRAKQSYYVLADTFDGFDNQALDLTLTDNILYVEIWLKDNTDLYFDIKAEKNLEYKYSFGSMNFVATFDYEDLSDIYFVSGERMVPALTDGFLEEQKGYLGITLKPDQEYFSGIVNGSFDVNPGMDGTAFYLGEFCMTLTDAVEDKTKFDDYMVSGVTDEILEQYSGLIIEGMGEGYSYLQKYNNGDQDVYLYGFVDSDDSLLSDEMINSSIARTDWSAINGIGQSEAIREGGIYVRTVTSATETEKGFADTIGTNVDYVTEWTTHFAEIWVKVSDTSKFTDVSVDFAYDNNYFNATGVEYGDFFSNGTCSINDDGTITGISANAGKAFKDGYVLLARVKMECVEKGGVAFENCDTPLSLGWELSNGALKFADGSSFAPILGQSSTTELWGVAYDANDDGLINVRDYNYFITWINKVVTFDNALARMFDYNSDGNVNVRDYNYLISMFNTTWHQFAKGDRKLVLSSNFNQRYVGSTLQTEENSAWVGTLLDSAKAEWSEKIDTSAISKVSLVVKNLADSELAISTTYTTESDEKVGVIYLDDDALGNTWYAGLTVDVSGSLKYDLYTVILHELGHLYGYEHSVSVTDLMYETLTPGTRRTLDDCAALNELLDEEEDDQIALAGNTTVSNNDSALVTVLEDDYLGIE